MRTLLALSIVPLLALTACGGGGQSAPPKPTVVSLDPCALVTRQEAASVLHTPVGDPQPTSRSGEFNQCQYAAPAAQVGGRATVTVQVYPVDFAAKRKSFETAGEKLEEVAGVGEGAVWDAAAGTLYVGKHGRTAGFSAAAPAIDMKAASQALAEKGLTRLP